MSDEQQTQEPQNQETPAPTEEQKKDAEKTKSALDGVGLGTIVSGATGLIAAVMGAGWAGVVALVLGSGALVFMVQYAIKWINRSVDQRDLQNAGADAGETAVDIKNQAGQVRQDLDDLEKLDPPVPPKPPGAA